MKAFVSKIRIITITVLMMCLTLAIVSCSADALQNADNTIGRLEEAGFGKAGEKLVDKAEDSIFGFTDEFEACFIWSDPLFTTEEETGRQIASGITLRGSASDPEGIDGNGAIISLVGETVSDIV